MNPHSAYLLIADGLLLAHALFVLFVICGLLLIVAGRFLSWRWVRNPWFRLVHLVCIGIVVVQSWFGIVCPLTTWEMALREKAGQAAYDGSFIAYWLSKVLYYQLPEWVFVLAYTIFGSLVLVSWYWVRPDEFGRRGRGN
ncbi:MAG: DUF2784 domain-containing protein [Gammaproteobacteria bacterium]|nr:DUF2784 domain-containing protein [Gammaproteobacteria bacterium]